ncbi:hypothetical protein J2Z76_001103 [Sedimentibacter acidaminivorans]|uniref:N-acetyltransferase domain-containing protein n=1 Tax=Sedimentibacter acidaminivorans TaxID=913099 RepID=A0ABS4GC30_9FIRM|nr:hypothetical protein [Sedimentibacter acidaminivorans]
MITPILESKRIILRPLSVNDAEDITLILIPMSHFNMLY